ncbi:MULTISPECIES: co-chaperone DjlA [Vibrio]|uniref:Co-chaperone protein DjlA n=1 Tax=Vibrio algicola TaxID=2662262 RepID=A0A5Q0TI77_9VIBR|nr:MULTISPECIES: co-chaperone DjlA [Vibrio]MBD1575266.1 co-chaperone DjlA [Vibrio sp. S11_S32]
MIGKLLGILFGSMVGNIPGAIIGCFIGHMFDKARTNQQGFQSAFGSGASQAERQTEFFQAAYAVMGHVAKAKGQVTKEEIQLANVMMDRMNLSAAQKTIAQEAFRQGKEASFPLQETLRKVRFSAGRRRDLLQFFLELQISAAFADGDLHPSEIQVLQVVAQELGFTAQYLQQRLRMQEAAFRFQQQGGFGGYQHQGQQSGGQWQQQTSASQLNHAYDLLGVSKDDDAKTIKRAHRKLMNEHHPDKLVAKGLPQEMMEVAKQKAQEIQSAYDLIKKEKGFK